MELDRAVLSLLGLSAERTTSTALSGNGSSRATTRKITSRSSDGSEKAFFMKTSSDPEASLLVQGEHASLQAIHAAVPGLSPQSLGTGTYDSSPSTSFIVIDFLQLSKPIFPTITGIFDSLFAPRRELAAKLTRLHTTPAPIPEGFTKAQFGFPVTTCCGDTPQDNSFKSSWATFFAENRLKYILHRCETYQGVDFVLRRLVEDVVAVVVPRLLGDRHLGNGNGVTPVVVHGDLWYGNVGRCTIPNEPPRDIIFDPSAFYAHSEYELAIMLMFGGFSRRFFAAYHALCPKTEPVEEYDDRLKLYQLYHYLNHFAIFGPNRKYSFFGHTYREGSLRLMRQLLQKYR
ncbi:fructosamine-3-kinase [Nemania sp. FL0031]|nr:fructosamine-3-kinase [Nemania sp. FL0031]